MLRQLCAASFTYFGEVLRCPHKRIVTITKVYIARNNIHVEIIRSRFIQKVECQIQEHSRTFLGGKEICSRTFPARHSHILFTILPTEPFRLMKHVYNVNLRRPNLTVTDNK